MARKVDVMILNALAQNGDPYVLGAEASYSDPNPKRFDCSELTSWAAARAGLVLPDGAWAQYVWCKNHHTEVSVQQAIGIKGALLFVAKGALRGNGTGNHVAFSLGNGQTIEARGRKYGVGVFNARGRTFNKAGLVPGGDYFTPAPAPPPAPKPSPLPVRPWLQVGDHNRQMEILQWELAAATGARFDGETGIYWGKTVEAIQNLGRVLGKNWDGKTIGPDQWAAVDFLYKAKGHDPVLA
jgi:cell wall-associated NlpC family hydrolase